MSTRRFYSSKKTVTRFSFKYKTFTCFIRFCYYSVHNYKTAACLIQANLLFNSLLHLFYSRQFRIFDDDGNRFLDLREFTKGCADFGADLTKEEVKEIFELLDKDGSGHIDFDEFLEALRVCATYLNLLFCTASYAKMQSGFS